MTSKKRFPYDPSSWMKEDLCHLTRKELEDIAGELGNDDVAWMGKWELIDDIIATIQEREDYIAFANKENEPESELSDDDISIDLETCSESTQESDH